MDSRLRGNDKQIADNRGVIPAKAGIHAGTTKTFKKSTYIYLELLYIEKMSTLARFFDLQRSKAFRLAGAQTIRLIYKQHSV